MTGREKTAAELRAAGKYMMDNGLAWGNAGNISARLDDGSFLITATGTFLGELGEDDFAECSLSSGMSGAASQAAAAIGKKPSKEVPMHAAIYEERPEIGAVLHASPFYSTMFACAAEPIPSGLFVETMYYLERIERVGYHHPGSAALGEAVREKAKSANVLLLNNHGVLVYDVNVKEARMALQTLEMACRMVVEALGAGISLNRLPKTVERDFLERSGYRARRTWQP
ncbi:class II aldolase/adducin family protein [Paenibacillus sacheonensis]|uniref:Class II aldolase/adducin family protein n=1 Tax=Paenibacillus sacheonensis TaxID=742054 RepID=A0A7X4YLG7_9BACL|nr:class II aldolase/adducin family protein [Paenibacillus sacheonensis]MBM7564039.1 L-fuculose-phosphate aldolase [Paenibacillus sacheonensis]NBC67629.1 class II aldolase/adducin family protein [Paenibacillus sacheonensis]